MSRTMPIVVAVVLALVVVAGRPSLASARPHHHSHCKERSPTLGRKVCTKFGAWSTITRLPPITPELWFGVRSFEPPGHPPRPSVSARAEAVPPPTLFAPAAGLRWSVVPRPGLYLGFGVDGGPVLERSAVAGEAKTASGFFATGTLHAGLRQRMGRITLSGELAAGGMVAPIATGPPMEDVPVEPFELGARFMLEGRGRADVWLNPWFTAGAFVGADLQGRGVSGGLQLGLHLRALDAGR